MEILKLVPGSKEWLKRRRKHYSASNAPVMMGEEKYISRLQLKNHYKGWISEVDEFTQKIFDKGHAAEDSARPIVGLNEFLTLEVVVAIETVEGLDLLASYDGAELDGCLIEISWEHKLYNQDLYENVRNSVLEAFYYWQLEHQMLVASINKCLFTCSNGTGELMATMTYESVPERREALIKGWVQFDKEMQTHEKTAKTLKVESVKVKSLPELKINVLSEIQSNNLFNYTSAARSYIAKINETLESDQDFEDAKANIKHLKKSEDKISEVSQSILDGNIDVKSILDQLSELKKYSATKRLNLGKLVKEQSELKKENLKLTGKALHQENIDLLMVDTGGLNVGFATPDLDIAIKGLSNFDSMKSKIESAVANVNISNVDLVEEYLSKKALASEMLLGVQFLFSDFDSLISLNNKENLVITIENAILKYNVKLEEDKKAIQERLDNLNGIPKNYEDKPLESIKAKIKSLENYNVEKDDFGDMYREALQSVAGVICELKEMHYSLSYFISEDENKNYDEENKPQVETVKDGVEALPIIENPVSKDNVDLPQVKDEILVSPWSSNHTVTRINNPEPVIDFDEDKTVIHTDATPKEIKTEYDDTEMRLCFLQCLIAAGVDNWSDGYDMAIDEFQSLYPGANTPR